jgi:hypothetical protein
MAWTSAESDRVKTIEEVVNDLQTAVNNLMSKAQMRQLLFVKQSEVDNLTQRVATLERLLQIVQQHLQ